MCFFILIYKRNKYLFDNQSYSWRLLNKQIFYLFSLPNTLLCVKGRPSWAALIQKKCSRYSCFFCCNVDFIRNLVTLSIIVDSTSTSLWSLQPLRGTLQVQKSDNSVITIITNINGCKWANNGTVIVQAQFGPCIVQVHSNPMLNPTNQNKERQNRIINTFNTTSLTLIKCPNSL